MKNKRYRSLPLGFFKEGLSAEAIALYTTAYTAEEMNLSGAIFISKDRMAERAGIKSSLPFLARRKVDKAIAELGDMVRWWPQQNVLFLTGFAMQQSSSSKVLLGALYNAQKLPREISEDILKYIYQDFLREENKPWTKNTETIEMVREILHQHTVSDIVHGTVSDTQSKQSKQSKQTFTLTHSKCKTVSDEEKEKLTSFFLSNFKNRGRVKKQTLENQIEKALQMEPLDYWENVFSIAAANPFLAGVKTTDGKKPFVITIPFLVGRANEIIAGEYEAFDSPAETGDRF